MSLSFPSLSLFFVFLFVLFFCRYSRPGRTTAHPVHNEQGEDVDEDEDEDGDEDEDEGGDGDGDWSRAETKATDRQLR